MFAVPKNPRSWLLILLVALVVLLTACGSTGSGSTSSSDSNSSTTLADKQVLRYPNVGTADIGKLDPASGPDANSNEAISMIFSGLVRADSNLHAVPDQASSWDISKDNKVYTFHLKSGIKFSDGTPVTAQTYVYSWTRVLLPAVKSPIAPVLEEAIMGANDVLSGKTTTLSGVKALDDHTFQVTLVRPTAYFLQLLTVSLFYPVNQSFVEKYGQTDWVNHVVGNGAGTGPFMVKSWQRNVSMTLVPNPNYYGARTKLKEVDMTFVRDVSTGFRAYQAGQYDFVDNISAIDQLQAQSMPGFTRKPILESDLLFFDNKTAPFNNTAVRQAFAAAIDKQALVKAVYHNSVTPASTIIPPDSYGAQDYAGIPYDPAKAKELLKTAYPDSSKIPTITFSYPSTQVPSTLPEVLQQMWKNTLGINVKLNGMELTSYNAATTKRNIQFGFTQWGVYFPDPYEWLDLSLLSTSPNNNGSWSNAAFDQTVAQAEQTSGEQRIALYNKAEQIAIDNVGWLPLDHQSQAAVVSNKVHGLKLGSGGFYFGDWSDIYLTK
ncbi:peptide ABC transporter substrate-binding protein [Dictyobacter arantiisoli]|uniref:ABC transporter substrate-binding protein n=1 Tax=Dictyobacter arantiisoli TaxID=2014874 RepID=A0A5A5TK54_9CHLR|nr:peptide ABC transporter substrate-binding protein [Dictyobacter arantiisoli]GCF11409.1 ABC transporter substrate-binding protein [Dictyobacter arantiisoli]